MAYCTIDESKAMKPYRITIVGVCPCCRVETRWTLPQCRELCTYCETKKQKEPEGDCTRCGRSGSGECSCWRLPKCNVCGNRHKGIMCSD